MNVNLLTVEPEEFVSLELDRLAKPPKSFGVMEYYLPKVAKALGYVPDALHPHHVIFAGNNGIADRELNLGITNFDSSLNADLVSNVKNSTAVISCLCNSFLIPLSLNYFADSTKSFTENPKTTTEKNLYHVRHEAIAKMLTLRSEGYNLISFGEIGIGNTTTASAVFYALTDELLVGYGANAGMSNNEKIAKNKTAVISKYVKRVRTAREAMETYGSYELVGLMEAMLACRKFGLPFVIDGFATSVALYCACHFDHKIVDYAFPSHTTTEPGTSRLLSYLGLNPAPLQLGMGIGEGTGAVMMANILRASWNALINGAKL